MLQPSCQEKAEIIVVGNILPRHEDSVNGNLPPSSLWLSSALEPPSCNPRKLVAKEINYLSVSLFELRSAAFVWLSLVASY